MNPTQPVALVTGSSRGIGAAIAAQLRDRGVGVIGHATRAVDAETVAADFADPAGARLAWEEAMERSGGRLDVLVNNAGRFAPNPIDLPETFWSIRYNG